MNKKWLLFFLFSTILTSCENTISPNPYQLQIDSTVSAKLAEHQANIAVKNDSILNAMANQKADSLVKHSN